MNPADQQAVDSKLKELDGTPQKERLGANAITAVSIAVCKVGELVTLDWSLRWHQGGLAHAHLPQ
jgi:enolase